MPKKDEEQHRVGPREDAKLAFDSLVLQDKDGNYIHIGELVNRKQLEAPEEEVLTVEEQLEWDEATAWFDSMLDPDNMIEIIDAGVATGEDYVEPTKEEAN